MSGPDRVTIGPDRFGDERFWTKLRWLAARSGHSDHATYLTGATSPTNEYAYTCAACQFPIVIITVDRDGPPGMHREA